MRYTDSIHKALSSLKAYQTRGQPLLALFPSTWDKKNLLCLGYCGKWLRKNALIFAAAASPTVDTP